MRKKQVKKFAVKKPYVLATFVATLLLAVFTAYVVVHHSNLSTIALRIDKPIVYDQGSYPYIPGTGRRYVIITVHITNHTTSGFAFAPVVQTYLTDSSGARYEMAPTSLDNPIQAGTIAPGRTQNGQLSYAVPNNATNLVLHFAANSPAKEILLKL